MTAPDLPFIRRRGRRPPAPAGPPDLGFLRRRPRRPRPGTTPTPPPATTSPPVTTSPPAPVPSDAVPSPAGHSPAGRGASGPRLAGRTVLTSTSPSVTVPPAQASSGALHLTLGWSAVPNDAGITGSTDVHLGCLWEMNDGESGVIQSLGSGPDHAPGHGSTVLRLGPRSETRGETLTVALAQVHRLKRLVLFGYARSGSPRWSALAPVLVGELRDATVELRVESEAGLVDPARREGSVCVLASLHRVGDELVLRREAQLVDGQQQQAAEEFGWDLAWADGRTVPPARTYR